MSLSKYYALLFTYVCMLGRRPDVSDEQCLILSVTCPGSMSSYFNIEECWWISGQCGEIKTFSETDTEYQFTSPNYPNNYSL